MSNKQPAAKLFALECTLSKPPPVDCPLPKKFAREVEGRVEVDGGGGKVGEEGGGEKDLNEDDGEEMNGGGDSAESGEEKEEKSRKEEEKVHLDREGETDGWGEV